MSGDVKNAVSESALSLDQLRDQGRLSWLIHYRLVDHGAATLGDVADWSRAELLRLNGVGVKKVEALQELMAEFGLSLHADRARPKHRRSRENERWEAELKAREAAKWSDRAYLLEQATRLESHAGFALTVLDMGYDDVAFRAALVKALKCAPPTINPLARETERCWKAGEAARRMERRETGTPRPKRRQDGRNAPDRRSAREHQGDNVIPFPAPAARARSG